MKRALVALSLMLATVPAHAETMKLFSHYDVAGKNPDGSSYTGRVDITVISDTTFSIVWKISGSTYKGFGMRMNDALSATYTLDGQPGLVIYKAQGSGTLSGLWAVRGEDGSGSETLTPAK